MDDPDDVAALYEPDREGDLRDLIVRRAIEGFAHRLAQTHGEDEAWAWCQIADAVDDYWETVSAAISDRVLAMRRISGG